MFVAVLMFAAVLMLVAMLVLVAVLMFMAVFMWVFMCRFIEDDVKITGINAVFLHTTDLELIAGQVHTGQSIEQYLLVGAEIEQGSNGHVPADARIAFQIKFVRHRENFLSLIKMG